MYNKVLNKSLEGFFMNKFWIASLSVSVLLSTFSLPGLSQNYPANYNPQYLNYYQSQKPRYQYPQYYYHYHPHTHSVVSVRHSAILAYKKRNYARAAVLLKRAIARYPGDAGLMTKYGYSLMKLRRFGASLAVFEKVASTTTIKKYKAYASGVIPKLKKAIAEIKSKGRGSSAARSATETPGITFHDSPKVQPTGQVQAPSAPSAAGSDLKNGKALLKQGFFDQAIEKLTQTITQDQNNAEAYFNRAMAFRFKRKYEIALNDLNRSAELGYKDKMLFYERGWIYSQQAKVGPALTDLNQAIEMDPNFIQALVTRGSLYSKQNNCTAANDDYQQACELGNKDACSSTCPSSNVAPQDG